MGDSTPRKQPPDAKGTGESREEAGAAPQRESQPKPAPPPARGPAKEQGPQGKFHGDKKKQGPQSKFHG